MEKELEEILNSIEYQNSSIEEKNNILLQVIKSNLQLFEQNVNSKEKRKIESEESSTKENFSKKENNKPRKNFIYTKEDYSYLENMPQEEMIYHLPKKGEKHFQNKVSIIMCQLRHLIDTYDTLLLTTEDEEMKIYIKEAKRELEEKLEYIKVYREEYTEKIDFERKEHIQIIYFDYYGQNLFLNDLLKEEYDTYDSYLLLLNSIKGQTFRELKRINLNNMSLYEVRHNQQRIIFDLLNSNTIIIIQAFTKKVLTDKKYRLNLENRMNKYATQKKKIRDNLIDIIIEQQENNEIISELLLNKNKKIIKRENRV